MRTLAPWLLFLALAVGCRAATVSMRPEPGSGPAAAQLRTTVSIDEAACGVVPAVSTPGGVRDQMELARALAHRADDRFLAAVEDRVPFAVAKAPWKDRPVIELSLEDVRIERAPEGSTEPPRVRVRIRLEAELPESGLSLNRELSYERALPVEPGAVKALECLAPAVEEAATLAAGWLVEATAPAPPPADDDGAGEEGAAPAP